MSADAKEGGKLLLLLHKGDPIDQGGDEGGEEGGGAGQGDAGGATSLRGGRQVEEAGEKLKKKKHLREQGRQEGAYGGQ